MKEFIDQQLASLRSSGRIRELNPLTGRNGCHIHFKGRRMLNLSSNDYLGLAGDAGVQKDFYSRMTDENILEGYGLGSASSRLLSGDNEISHKLETTLKTNYDKEACLLFNSGYHANIGILPALLQKRDLILSDKLNHASITDGLRLSSAAFKRYHHCDYQHLRWLLEKYRSEFERVIIVSESVFSMDGDVVDLDELVKIKEQFNALLYIDEAHGVGLYGEKGLGIAEQQGHIHNVDLLIGTFGKALASVGAFVLCSKIIKEYLVNTSRSLIFTTALPPVIIHWNRYIFEKAMKLQKERKDLALLSEQLRNELVKHGLRTDGSTNIVPVMLGDDSLAVSLGKKMQELGYLIFPVRPPTVPEGTSRFRLSLTADMTWRDVELLPPLIVKGLEQHTLD